MDNCVKYLNLNGDVYEFNTDNELNDFIKRNYHRLKLYNKDNDSYIRFSKNTNDFQLESIAIIDSILKEGKDIKSKISELGDKEIDDQLSYKGVTRILGEIKINGKPIIKKFDLDNYRMNVLPIEVEKLMGSGNYDSREEAEIKAKQIIENNISQFKKLGEFGTELHYISDLYFKEGINNPMDILSSLKEKFNKDFNIDVVEKMTNIITDLHNKILKDHGKDAKIYTELPIYDNDTKILGIIDLLVIDNQGRAHIYDYKTSHKKEHDWGNTKINTIKYQMAMYNQLVAKKGIPLGTTNIIPIYLSNIDFESNIVNEVDGDGKANTVIPIESMYRNVAMDIIPVSFSDYRKQNVNTPSIQDELQKACGYSIQNKFEDVNTYEGEDGHTYVRNALTGRSIKLSDNPNIREQQIKQYKEEYFNKENAEVQIMKNNAEQYMKNGLESVSRLYPNRERANSFISMFGRYTDGCWEIINDPELESQGIIAFENKYTNTVDFISMTTNNIHNKLKLSKGNTLLGNFVSDRSLYNERGILPSTVSNIEGLKVAMWLNANHKQFSSIKQYNIGEVRVCSPNMRGGVVGVNMQDIISNYAKICKYTGTKFNLSNVNYQNPYDIIIGKLNEIMKNENNLDVEDVQVTKSKISNLWIYSKLKSFVEEESIGNNYFENITQSEKDDKIKKIEEMQSYIEKFRDNKKTSINMNDEIDVLYGLLANAHLYYMGLRPVYTDDIKNAAINNSKNFTPIQFHSNPMIEMLHSLWTQPKHNIGIKYKKVTDDITDILTEYFKHKGFNRFEQLIVGDIKNQFENLWVKDNTGKPTKDFMLKRPDDKSLNKYESDFIRKYFEILDAYRYSSIKEKEEAIENGDYYRMPLIRAENIQRLKQKGVISGVKDSFINALNFNNFLKDDQEQNKIYSETKKEIYNPYRLNDNTSKREELINQNGVEAFDWDLQNIIRTYTLYSIKEKEFNRILPAMRNIETAIVFMNNGLSTGKSENMFEFVHDYIKTSVFNEKLIEPHLEGAVKIGAKMKEFTSALLLGFNIPAGVRDSLQGFVSNIVTSASKAYGYHVDPKALLKAYSFLTSESKDFIKNVNLVDSMNHLYMISTEDINLLNKKHAIAQNGIIAFKSEQLYWQNSVADYGNRMGLFIARLIEDGSLEAHKLVNNRIVYDWKLDNRFNIYRQFYKNPNNVPEKYRSEFNKQRGLYITLMNDFNRNKTTEKPLVEGDDLPQAYTFKEIESIKSFSNLIHGYYDSDSKIRFHNTWFGVMFMQFKAWLTAKKDQLLLEHNEYANIGKMKQGRDIEGNLLWMKQNDNGGFDITSENTGIPYYAFEGSIMEGMFQSVYRAMKICYQSKYNFREAINIIKEDETIPGNLKNLMADLLIVMMMGLFTSSIDWKEFRKESPVTANITRTISKCVEDLNPFLNIKNITNPQSFVPSIAYMFDIGEAVNYALFNENHKVSKAMFLIGAARPFAYSVDNN